MNDLSNILAKFLPVAVIGGLLAVFYLLDVFSVHPGLDGAAPVSRVLEQASTSVPTTPLATESSPPAASPPPATAVANPIPQPVQSNNVPTPAPPLVVQSPAPMSRPVESPPINSSPRYLPPPGAGMPQPLASERAPTEAPVELPVHEINQDDGEQIDAETQRAVEQPEPPSPSGGGDG